MKQVKNLLNVLSNEDCYPAYKKAFENAEQHKQSAIVIANIKNYGGAITHLILGTEELVKGLLLYVQSLNIDLRGVPDIHLFFTDHIIRHRFATYTSLMYNTIKPFMGIVYKKHEELHNPKSKIEYTPTENAIMSKDEEQLKVIFRDLPDLLDWWDEANDKKNDGLYVGFKDGLKTPTQIEKSAYLKAMEITESFKDQLKEIIDYFEKLTKEEKQQTARFAKTAKITGPLIEIIQARKEERKNENKPFKPKIKPVKE